MGWFLMGLKESAINDLVKKINQMNQDFNECKIIIPSKGKFKITLQTEYEKSINEEVIADPSLEEMIKCSREAYHNQNYKTTKELIQTIKDTDFSHEK
jgi:hypothetical protein